jgi:hypothetical protein
MGCSAFTARARSRKAVSGSRCQAGMAERKDCLVATPDWGS